MATPAPRRRPTRTPSEQDDVDRLVRHIASEPHLEAWLREHVAGHLEQTAHELSRADLNRVSPESVVARRADAHRRGDTAIW
ncbi:hypothetical protein [Modestobacter sp. VKM Ac-2985]|uniref:hypothetical protein n=1 Tax=Modestobacter sp. VKM Ac-2985 TaxID=3004139 RepID=UPI0022AB5CCF|nr:hypothetical protein [Modestobacter sp. VKM Ac-2985]MCZ2837163.1 hypothetical protein [Modestobacter sp. VKM Ac-2985]